jgi:hypothetical protein
MSDSFHRKPDPGLVLITAHGCREQTVSRSGYRHQSGDSQTVSITHFFKIIGFFRIEFGGHGRKSDEAAKGAEQVVVRNDNLLIKLCLVRTTVQTFFDFQL